MERVEQDLRHNVEITFHLDEGVSYQPSISGITTMDTGYTLTINSLTKTVGSGLTLGADSILIDIGNTDFPVGEYEGCLISDSRVAGIYKRFQIKIIVTSVSC